MSDALVNPRVISFTERMDYIAVSLNATGDVVLPLSYPKGFTRASFSNVRLSGASADIHTGTFGVFTQAAGAGLAIVAAATAITITTAADATNNNSQQVAGANSTTETFQGLAAVYFRIGTAVAGATVNVSLQVTYLP